MTAPITAARTGGISFSVAGIPVTLHVSFLLVIGLLGFGLGSTTHVAVWAGVATVAVLLHELGHGLVGRLAGLRPRIDLAGFGGVTSWSTRQDGRGRTGLGRGWSLAISLAGPAFGFLGGGVALLLGAPCCGVPAGGDLGDFAAGVWLFASFGWGILNLLPILPLDGGQALRELLPGSPAERLQRAAVVGVVAGGALVAWALVSGATFLALLAGWITWSNVQQVQAARQQGPDGVNGMVAALQEAARGDDPDAVIEHATRLAATAGQPPRIRRFAVGMLVRGLLAAGRVGEAYALVTDPRREVALPTELVGGVLARHPDPAAVDTVVRGWVARSQDRDVRGIAAVVLAWHGHHEEVLTLVRGATDTPAVDAGVGLAVQTLAHQAGAHATASEIGTALLGDGGLRSPVLAYNTACSLARTGRPDDAVAALSEALRLGFSDLDMLQGDSDLAALHGHPAWPGLVAGEPVPDVPGGQR